ncbi:hypothetical protein ACFYYP_25430 [Microbispora rosea]|uniref:hypothetical protein n=1 Tax=Microbispora rosea TaxID=58117 RepID=UPI0036CE57F4
MLAQQPVEDALGGVTIKLLHAVGALVLRLHSSRRAKFRRRRNEWRPNRHERIMSAMWASLRYWGTALLGLAALPAIVIVTQATDDLTPARVPVWEVLRAGVMLLAGAWAGGRAQSRGIGRILLLGGVLGVVQLICELPGIVIVSDGTAASWEEWLHYWIWVPQVMAPLLLATAFFPDGRPALPIAVTFSILAIVMTSFTVATYNWPRSDGGAGYNPVFMFLRLPPYPSIVITLVIVLVAAAYVLASLVIRWKAGEAAVRRPLLLSSRRAALRHRVRAVAPRAARSGR